MDRARLAAFSANNDGVLPLEYLESIGVSRRSANRLVANGEWGRRFPAVYLDRSVPPSTMQEVRAVAAAVSAGVIVEDAAAWLHGIGAPPERVALAVPKAQSTRLAGVTVRRYEVAANEQTRRAGVTVTTLERTISDLARTWSVADLYRCICDVIVDRRTTLERLDVARRRADAARRRGVVRLRDALDALDGMPPPESELESQFAALIARGGLPMPERQVTLPWMEAERGRVDFWFPAARVIVEVDGRRYHARSDAFERDRVRDQQALVNGVRTLRFTWRQVVGDEGEVARVLRPVLGAWVC